MYRQDFHLQTLTCLAIAISPLCKLVPHWFGFCVRFLKNFNSLQTWSFICCNSWTNTDVHTARHQIWDTVSAGTFRLGLSGLKKPCSFNSILVVTNPNFLHELAPLYVQTGFPSSDIDMSRHCDFSIMQACSALIWILRQIRSAGVGSQTSLTLSNLAMTTTNGRGAVRFKFWLNLVSIIL